MKDMWRQYSEKGFYSGARSAATNDGPDACTYQGQTFFDVVVKNLNTALWNQWGSGYNTNINMTCSSNPGGKAPTGCVATAVGIIMKYYQYPSYYNWSSMYDAAGSSETARLLYDLGISSNLNMTYACDGSSAYMSRVPSTFGNFGYPQPSRSSYSPSTVHNEIYENRPVILSGGKNGNWWIFNTYTDGHAWVADGFRDTNQRECRQNPYNPSEWNTSYVSTTTQFWMNWGWGGSQYNGWYSAGNFNPGSSTYNYQPEMITNIHP